LTLSIGVLTLSFGLNAQLSGYAVGDVVDDFTVTDTEGNIHNLYSITASGKHVYLDFFFDACLSCELASPKLGEFYDKYGCNEGEVYCLLMNDGSDSNAETIAYAEAYGGPGNHPPAISADGGAGAVDAAFGIIAYPVFCMIGPDNKLINADIWPLAGVSTFEETFYGDFNPSPMACGPLSIEEETSTSFALYPNPAQTSTTIVFDADEASEGVITLFNILGEVVLNTAISTVNGSNSFELDIVGIQAGNYIVQVQLGATISTSRLEILN
jgi:hypothetical protein